MTDPTTTPLPAGSSDEAVSDTPRTSSPPESSQATSVEDATRQVSGGDDGRADGGAHTARHAAADDTAGTGETGEAPAARNDAGDDHLADDGDHGAHLADDEGDDHLTDDEAPYDEDYDEAHYDEDEDYDDEPHALGGTFADDEDYDDIVEVEPWSGTAQRWDIAEDDDENPHLVLSHLDDDVAIDAPITPEMIDGLCLSMDYYPEPPAHSSTLARTSGWAAASRAWDSIPAEYRKWVTIGVILIVVATLILRIVMG